MVFVISRFLFMTAKMTPVLPFLFLPHFYNLSINRAPLRFPLDETTKNDQLHSAVHPEITPGIIYFSHVAILASEK